MILHQNQRVKISGAAGVVTGRVLHVETPATLPSINGAPEVDRIRAILAEDGIDELAMIGHKHNGKDACFLAIHRPSGWKDRQGQELTITPAPAKVRTGNSR